MIVHFSKDKSEQSKQNVIMVMLMPFIECNDITHNKDSHFQMNFMLFPIKNSIENLLFTNGKCVDISKKKNFYFFYRHVKPHCKHHHLHFVWTFTLLFVRNSVCIAYSSIDNNGFSFRCKLFMSHE